MAKVLPKLALQRPIKTWKKKKKIKDPWNKDKCDRKYYLLITQEFVLKVNLTITTYQNGKKDSEMSEGPVCHDPMPEPQPTSPLRLIFAPFTYNTKHNAYWGKPEHGGEEYVRSPRLSGSRGTKRIPVALKTLWQNNLVCGCNHERIVAIFEKN